MGEWLRNQFNSYPAGWWKHTEGAFVCATGRKQTVKAVDDLQKAMFDFLKTKEKLGSLLFFALVMTAEA